MKTFNINNIRFLSIISLILISSCKKLIEVGPPVNESTVTTIFSNEGSASTVLYGLYADFVRVFDSSSSAVTFSPSFSCDELKDNTSNYLDFYTNLIKLNNTNNSLLIWRNIYGLIYESNTLLEGIQTSTILSKAVKDQFTGEAKFMRAFMNFELVNLYGDAPLILTTDVRINSIMPRTPKDQIYSQIISDLQDAQNLLSDAYAGPDRARINKSSATALLARVYLYLRQYNDAEIQSTNVINEIDIYKIEKLENTFLKASKETIFQIANTDGYTNLGQIIVPSSDATKVNYSFTDDFKNAIEPKDNRKNVWMNSLTIAGINYVYPYKYKKSGPTTGSGSEYFVVLRLAEQYLIRAEARAQLNKLDEAKADLNIIRQRSGLDDNTQDLKSDLLTAIEKERRIELFTEFGHRWFDLKRTDRANTVLGALKSTWKPTAVLYPIPLNELNNNPFLIQNPGY